jgi:hypothetical protein
LAELVTGMGTDAMDTADTAAAVVALPVAVCASAGGATSVTRTAAARP